MIDCDSPITGFKSIIEFISQSTGTGLLVGSVFSLVLLRRRMWPITFGTGIGLGFAASDLQHDLNARN